MGDWRSKVGDFVMLRRPAAFFVNAAICGAFTIALLVFAVIEDDPPIYHRAMTLLWLCATVMWVVRGVTALRRVRDTTPQ